MTDTDSTVVEDKEVDRRAAYIAGLRQLATFLEAHPDLPCPWGGSQNAFIHSKADLAHLARTSGVRWDKRVNGDYFFLSVEFDGGHTYEVNIARNEVCRKVVTGKRIEPATPEREVEEFHWVCDEPLLAEVRS